jgi:hypothetical protein
MAMNDAVYLAKLIHDRFPLKWSTMLFETLQAAISCSDAKVQLPQLYSALGMMLGKEVTPLFDKNWQPIEERPKADVDQPMVIMKATDGTEVPVHPDFARGYDKAPQLWQDAIDAVAEMRKKSPELWAIQEHVSPGTKVPDIMGRTGDPYEGQWWIWYRNLQESPDWKLFYDWPYESEAECIQECIRLGKEEQLGTEYTVRPAGNTSPETSSQ